MVAPLVPMSFARRIVRVAGVSSIFVLALGGCGSDGDVGAAPGVERLTIGDTVVVRAHGPGVWGDSAHVVEELRIGDADGGDEYGFANVGAMTVGRDGAITVYDYGMRALRRYDAAGRFVRTIGGTGDGPGEFRNVDGLALLDDGRLLVRNRGRINLYSPDGEPVGMLRIPTSISGGGPGDLMVDTAGRLYSPARFGDIATATGTRPRMGYLRLDSTGAVLDTILEVEWPMPEMFAEYVPFGTTRPHPHGGWLTAYAANYAVHLQLDGRPPLRIERADVVPIPITNAERTDILARRPKPGTGLREVGVSAEWPDVPEAKPALRGLLVADDGRLWVSPSVPSQERPEPVDESVPIERRPYRFFEPTAYDVFEADGTFLGRVWMPRRAEVGFVRGDTLWGVARDADNVPSVVRWRVVHVGAGEP